MATIKVDMSPRMKRWMADGDLGKVQRATIEGTRKLLPQVENTVKAKLDKSLKTPTGKYRASITSKVGSMGGGVVKSNDTRDMKTWIEARTRGGKKLGTGAYAWRAGKTFARNANKKGFYHEPLEQALK